MYILRKPDTTWPKNCTHAPKYWSWWKLLHFKLVELTRYDHGHLGYRLLVYSRWGIVSFDAMNVRCREFQRRLNGDDHFRAWLFRRYRRQRGLPE